jgi:hypothetical protein
MEDEILLLADESEYFRKVNPGKRGETIMILTVHRSGGIEEPHTISIRHDGRKLLLPVIHNASARNNEPESSNHHGPYASRIIVLLD